MVRARLRLALVASSVCAACAPEAATEQGGEVARLYDVFSAIAAGVFVLVAGLIAWSIVRYRARGRDDLPSQFHASVPLEVLWFAIPTAIVVVLFALSALGQREINREVTDPDLTVTVDGYQWGWRFAYEDGPTIEGTPDDPAMMMLPVNRPVVLELNSPDVVHSFYVPRFLIKRDVIPGRPNRIDLTIERPGTYRGVCAEFCGLMHDRMTFSIRAVTPAQFEQWLSVESQT